ncbi:MAG: radical SAM protein [Treponema sp.]|jgi:histidinol dehydrogenase|nr:radical SAM protein [Treponema sp.]
MSGNDGEFEIGQVENHRKREEGALVYPVYSRRSKGLSVGVNLFPDRKVCAFDCPYCEVFPFSTEFVFTVEVMERALKHVLEKARSKSIIVRDICFSGNGEPPLCPRFPAALEAAAGIRDNCAPEASLVVITSGAGLLDEKIFEFLREAASGPMALHIWLKLDAGTEEWYRRMNRSAVDYNGLIDRIRRFVTLAPVTIQTMLCMINGKTPSPEENAAWVKLAAELAASASGALATGALAPSIRGFQIYGKARPAPGDPLAEALPLSFLEERATALRKALAAAVSEANKNRYGPVKDAIPVEVFP